MKNILKRSIELIKQETEKELNLPEAAENIILNYSDGDARRMLNLAEMNFNIHTSDEPITKKIKKNSKKS
jgi:replication-associated recombination protein RarA